MDENNSQYIQSHIFFHLFFEYLHNIDIEIYTVICIYANKMTDNDIHIYIYIAFEEIYAQKIIKTKTITKLSKYKI